MFVDGRRMNCPAQLGDNLESISVRLCRAGFGMGIKPEISSPQLWFDHANAFARHDEKTGELKVVERIQSLAVGSREERARRLLWLDLPGRYYEKTIEEIDIEAQRCVSISAVGVSRIVVNTCGGIAINGLHVGQTGFFKTIRDDITVERLVAPQDSDPQYHPCVELIALTGTAFIMDSEASWRLWGREIVAPDLVGPAYPRTMVPLQRPVA